jgi:hypothetical protein
MDLVEARCDGVDRTGLVQDRGNWRAPVNAVMNLRVLYSAEKLPSGYTRLHGVSHQTSGLTVTELAKFSRSFGCNSERVTCVSRLV